MLSLYRVYNHPICSYFVMRDCSFSFKSYFILSDFNLQNSLNVWFYLVFYFKIWNLDSCMYCTERDLTLKFGCELNFLIIKSLSIVFVFYGHSTKWFSILREWDLMRLFNYVTYIFHILPNLYLLDLWGTE